MINSKSQSIDFWIISYNCSLQSCICVLSPQCRVESSDQATPQSGAHLNAQTLRCNTDVVQSLGE